MLDIREPHAQQKTYQVVTNPSTNRRAKKLKSCIKVNQRQIVGDMTSSHSTTPNTLGVERRPSFATPTKRLSMTDAVSSVGHRRVVDESEIEKNYAFGEVLGQGAFGVVREVTNRQTREQYAMKIVQKDKVSVCCTNLHLWMCVCERVSECVCVCVHVSECVCEKE